MIFLVESIYPNMLALCCHELAYLLCLLSLNILLRFTHYTSLYLKETSLPQFRKTNTDKKGYKFATCYINWIYWIGLCLLCFYSLGEMFWNLPIMLNSIMLHKFNIFFINFIHKIISISSL